jgi:hypothetical protein
MANSTSPINEFGSEVDVEHKHVVSILQMWYMRKIYNFEEVFITLQSSWVTLACFEVFQVPTFCASTLHVFDKRVKEI